MLKTNNVIFALIVFIFFYFSIEKIGLFSDIPSKSVVIMHSLPVRISGLALVVYFIFVLLKQKIFQIRYFIRLSALLVIVAGIWLSFAFRFSFDVFLTEGQGIVAEKNSESTLSWEQGRYLRPPWMAIKLNELTSIPHAGGSMTSLGGKLQVIMKKGDNPETVDIRKGAHIFYRGFWFSLIDFGFSPRFVLRDAVNRVLDSSFVSLKLFPPGKEDYFRTMLPYTFYLSMIESDGQSEEGRLQVRIANNKFVIFNKSVRIGEEIRFENGSLSFVEMRKWALVRVAKDWGLAVVWIGAFMLLIELTWSGCQKLIVSIRR